MPKHTPGVPIRESDAQQRRIKYVTANKSELCNKGEGDVKLLTDDDQQKMITFQNAKVGMPIVSTNKPAREGHDITFRADDGYIYRHEAKQTTNVIAREGVYVVKLKEPRSALACSGSARSLGPGLQS